MRLTNRLNTKIIIIDIKIASVSILRKPMRDTEGNYLEFIPQIELESGEELVIPGADEAEWIEL